MAIDTMHLRQVFGSFATGVTVMTCQLEDGRKGGMTANCFASLSLDPPLILSSVAKTADQFEIFSEAKVFAVNILSEDQQDVSARFAAQAADKFPGFDHGVGAYGAPVISGACAVLECRILERHEGGDHIVFISEVLVAERYEKQPLVYHGGAYARLAPR